MIETLVDRVQRLEEPHQAFLLKNFISVSRLLYLLRCSPTYEYRKLLVKIDNFVRRGAGAITNVHFDDNAWRQAVLPVRYGGLGIRSTADLALSAHLASLKASKNLISAINTDAR